MKNMLIFSILAFLLLSGCASQGQQAVQQPAPQNQSAISIQQAAPQQTAPPQPAAQFQNYSGPFFSFEYLVGMQTDSQIKNDSEGKAYGGVLVDGTQGQILLFWREYVPADASMEPTLPITFLAAFERDGDPLKMMDNATNKQEPQAHTLAIRGQAGQLNIFTRNVAELAFDKEQNGTTLHCYALEYYEPDLDRMVSVRISSESQENAKLLRDKFFATFMFSNWNEIMGTSG